VTVYWRLGCRQQNLLLLATSYVFYGWWDWRFLSRALERVGWTVMNRPGRANPLRKRLLPLWSLRGWILRFLVFQFVCLTWVLFRAQSFTQALQMYGGAWTFSWEPTLTTAVQFGLLFAAPIS
jgi:D-alanyl-lipoteichoic acid acyltransferase DltB (MBOAT superfamily)